MGRAPGLTAGCRLPLATEHTVCGPANSAIGYEGILDMYLHRNTIGSTIKLGGCKVAFFNGCPYSYGRLLAIRAQRLSSTMAVL